MSEKCIGASWLLVRLSLGFTLLWAFFDKLIGLGYSTCRDKATGEYIGMMCGKNWLSGGHPTSGFLSGASGPLGSVFKFLATPGISTVVDVLFMLGLLGIGLALVLGIVLRIGGYSGTALMLMMYLASFVPASNILIDNHIVYGSVFLLIAMLADQANAKYSLAKWWNNLSFVKDRKWLQ